ncbi:WD-repeat region-domain-containing protein [Gongronella butleri]|nr:WD-repeat region-domain-containing protein [Gongronella butleri]
MSFLHAFPYMAPADERGLLYRGFITLLGQEHYLEVQLPSRQQSFALYGSPELKALLQPHEKALETRLAQSQDIAWCLNDLKSLLEQGEKDKIATTSDREATKGVSAQKWKQVYSELSVIGFDKVHEMSDALDAFVFRYTDEKGRAHDIQARLTAMYPLHPPVMTLDLPATATIGQLLASASSDASNDASMLLVARLQDAYVQIEQLSAFFDAMDDVDAHARVLAPVPVKRADVWRRLALGNHCSVQVHVDPSHPTARPAQTQFFGHEKHLKPFQTAWSAYTWNPDASLFANLSAALPTIVSSSANAPGGRRTDEQDEMACAICFAYTLAGSNDVPTEICNNPHCNRGFHSSCIVEWLQSNPGTTMSFNILFGQCPYCRVDF